MCTNIGSCGGNFTAPNKLLASPSYPDQYPEEADCLYIISQPTGTVILLIVLSLDIDCSEECVDYWDFLEVRDGPSEASPVLGRLSGSDIPVPIQSSQNQVWML